MEAVPIHPPEQLAQASAPEPPSCDASLVRRARKGDDAALERLVDLHWERCWRVAVTILADRHAAEDVTQEAFVKAITRIGTFDERRRFWPWIRKVVVNRSMDELKVRNRRRESRLEVESLEQRRSEAREPWDGWSDLLMELPEEQRVLVGLRYLAGYGPKEIAGITGLPVGTIGSRLRRALDHLKERLEAEDG